MRYAMAHRPIRRGHGFFGNLLNKAKNFLQKTQAVSKIANAAASTGLLGDKYGSYAQKIGEVAGAHGYGLHRRHRAYGTHRRVTRRAYGTHRRVTRRAYGTHRRVTRRAYGTHRRVTHRRGKGFMDVVNKVGNFLKRTKLVSNVANVLGSAGIPYANAIGSVAGKFGYGKRRVNRRAYGTRRPIHRMRGHGVHHNHHIHHIHHVRGRGIGHIYTPQSGVGIAGTTVYSGGHVIF